MKNLIKLILIMFASIILNGCGGGGKSLPSDNDDVSEVKLTDLRLGYLVKGILYGPDGSLYEDRKFCNFDTIADVYWDDDQGHTYFTNQYEIVDESMIVLDNGVIIDTDGSGIFEEGTTYLIEGVQGIIFDWHIGSISTAGCVVEPL